MVLTGVPERATALSLLLRRSHALEQAKRGRPIAALDGEQREVVARRGAEPQQE
jgi:hypothetical protein